MKKAIGYISLFAALLGCRSFETFNESQKTEQVSNPDTSNVKKVEQVLVNDIERDYTKIDLPIDSMMSEHPEVYAFVKKFEQHVSKKEWSSLVPMYEPEAYSIQKNEFRMSDAQFLYELLNLSHWNINDTTAIYPDRIFTTMSKVKQLKIAKYSVIKKEDVLTFEVYGKLTSENNSLNIYLDIVETPFEIYIPSAVG